MEKRRIRKQLFGMVVSDKMDKTVTVLVERLVKHSQYKKYIKRHKKYAAHDLNNDCQIGDKVAITECRPLSKNKRFRISKIIEKAV